MQEHGCQRCSAKWLLIKQFNPISPWATPTHLEPYLSNTSAIHCRSPPLYTIFAESCSATRRAVKSSSGVWLEMFLKWVLHSAESQCNDVKVGEKTWGTELSESHQSCVARGTGSWCGWPSAWSASSPFGTQPFTPFHFPLQSVPAALLFFFFVLTSFQVVVNKTRAHQEQDTVQSSCSVESDRYFFCLSTFLTVANLHLESLLLSPFPSEYINAPSPFDIPLLHILKQYLIILRQTGFQGFLPKTWFAVPAWFGCPLVLLSLTTSPTFSL